MGIVDCDLKTLKRYYEYFQIDGVKITYHLNRRKFAVALVAARQKSNKVAFMYVCPKMKQIMGFKTFENHRASNLGETDYDLIDEISREYFEQELAEVKE